MQKLRLKFELNRGRIGIPFAKLAAFSIEANKFLESVASDVGILSPEWIAGKFDNGSVLFDCECDVQDDAARVTGYETIKAIIKNNRSDPHIALVQPRTWNRFGEMFKAIDRDEIVWIGLYNGAADPEMFKVTKDTLPVYEPPRGARYYGEIQGIVHAFFKEDSPPRFIVRELSTKRLINCVFDSNKTDMYEQAVELLRDKGAVIFVEGDIEEDAESGFVKTVYVKDFLPAPKFDLAKYKAGLGAFSGLTGEITTEEYIEQMRSNG